MTISCWMKLQNAALTDIHPSWVGDLPDELLGRARKAALGRRWLARRLAPDHGLFRQPAAAFGEDAVLGPHAWLCQPLSVRTDFILNLGAWALAPLLCAQVARVPVLRLKGLLGEQSYQRMIHDAPDYNRATDLGREFDASSLLASEAALKEGLTRQAAVEIRAFAQDVHWALGERVRLAFHRRWLLPRATAHLLPDAVRACERRCPAGPESAHD